MKSFVLRVALAAAVVLILLGEGGAQAFFVHGRVLADDDGDGRISAGDVPLGGVTVVLEQSLWVSTAADGTFVMDTPRDGIVWVRTPSGYAPGPVWQEVRADTNNDVTFLLALHPVEGPLRFVHASDPHIGQMKAAQTRAALAQAASGSPPPAFILLTGDITQASEAAEFDAYARAIEGIGVPIVPVTGNHDWADGGKGWRHHLGPPQWSFDAGAVHVVVMNGQASVRERLDFLDHDLELLKPGQLVVAALHFPITLPYDQALYEGLVARGVTHLFTGHYHANRQLVYPGLVEHNVQPIGFGGLDGMPAGYQVVTVTGSNVDVRELDVTEHPVFELIAPRPDVCIAAAPFELIVALQDGPGQHQVRARVDDGEWRLLEARGGWDESVAVDALAPGEHGLRLVIERPGAAPEFKDVTFCVASMDVPAELPEWPQLGGSSTHVGTVGRSLVPPLAMRWATTVGGHIHAPPVLADGRLFVSVADYGTGGGGGMVALDARTGARLWAFRGGAAVHGSPAVERGVVVVASVDGMLRGLDAATGAQRWQLAIDPTRAAGMVNLYASPLVIGGLAYIGTMYHFVAVDVATGEVRWQRSPDASTFFDPSHAAAAATEDTLVAPLGRHIGVFAYDTHDGAPAWTRASPVDVGVTAAPVIANGRLYTVNAATLVSVLRVDDGRTVWQRTLFKGGFDYAHWVWATPALSGDRLILPTRQAGLVAVSADDGAPLWTMPVGKSVVHPVHYQTTARSVSSPPVVTRDVVWSGGDDGVLREVVVSSGRLLVAGGSGRAAHGRRGACRQHALRGRLGRQRPRHGRGRACRGRVQRRFGRVATRGGRSVRDVRLAGVHLAGRAKGDLQGVGVLHPPRPPPHSIAAFLTLRVTSGPRRTSAGPHLARPWA